MALPDLIPIVGVVRGYEWGSPTAIPELLGVATTGEPVAELWFGTHPDDPSPSPEHGRTLDDLIADDPVARLGPAVVAEFGPSLPFLLKLLAADRPLSIQVHPDKAQAEAGFAAEDARGIAVDAPNRNYRDRNHKPELLFALTPFSALCGFRPIEATRRLLARLDCAELGFVDELLAGADGLRAAFSAILRLAEPAPLVAAVVARAAALDEAEFAPSLAAVATCASAFPGDVGVVLSLLLNPVSLAPGEAVYLGAGNVHAYLGGLGVEIMATSDNVLRCGLTPKHVDVDELLAITDFRPLADPRWHPAIERGSCVELDVPVPDFGLDVLELPLCGRSVSGPAIVLALGEETTLRTLTSTLSLLPGRAAFVPAGVAADLQGNGRAAVARVGRKI